MGSDARRFIFCHLLAYFFVCVDRVMLVDLVYVIFWYICVCVNKVMLLDLVYVLFWYGCVYV